MTSSPFRSAMVVGGRGALGSLLGDRLRASGVRDVYSLDVRAGAQANDTHALVGDVCALDPTSARIIGGCDLVILAVPAEVAERCAAGIASALARDALLVETLSVKSRLHALLADSHPRSCYLGINPMFAPDLGFAGRPVLVVGDAAAEPATRFTSLLESWGAELVVMDADQHDRALAALQVLTHASVLCFGLALGALDYRLDALASIAPPPHRVMIALLARIASNDPEVYRDIQDDNPYAAAARRAFANALTELEGATPSSAEFAALVSRLRALLGPDRERWNEACVRLFGTLDAALEVGRGPKEKSRQELRS